MDISKKLEIKEQREARLKLLRKTSNVLKKEVKDTMIVFQQLLEAPVVSVTSDACRHDSRPFVDVDKINQKNVLKMLGYTRFNSDNPIPSLKAQLNELNLDLTIFTKHSLLFMHLQHRIYDVLKHSKYFKYASLTLLMNRYDFVWQMDIMWDILENTKHSPGTYPLLVDLIDNRI